MIAERTAPTQPPLVAADASWRVDYDANDPSAVYSLTAGFTAYSTPAAPVYPFGVLTVDLPCGCKSVALDYCPNEAYAAANASSRRQQTCRACAEERAEGSGEHYLDHLPGCESDGCESDACPVFDAYAESLGGAL